jgi:predicted transcriptional regulator
VRERIAAEALAAARDQAKPVLKTETIKIDPALDRRVEDHCYAAGRLKQDVIRDAVLLYFETIEALEAEAAASDAGE